MSEHTAGWLAIGMGLFGLVNSVLFYIGALRFAGGWYLDGSLPRSMRYAGFTQLPAGGVMTCMGAAILGSLRTGDIHPSFTVAFIAFVMVFPFLLWLAWRLNVDPSESVKPKWLKAEERARLIR